jgi:hypothetical protein
MIYSTRVKMRQASENNTTSRMTQPKQVMYQHFAAIVVNSALLALHVLNARIAVGWGMPTAIRCVARGGLNSKARREVPAKSLRNLRSNKSLPMSKRSGVP